MIEHRKKLRAAVGKSILVKDVLHNRSVGRIVNLNEEGFMLIGDGLINENCLYQLSMQFESDHGEEDGLNISLGAECLWKKETDSGTQYWAGFHIIDISDDDLKKITLLVADSSP